MVLHISRMNLLLLILIVVFLSVQQERALGMTSLEIALRQSQKDHRIMLQNQHSEKTSGMELLNTKKNSTNVNNGFDPNQSSERRVRKGSDPIHNRT
ncbi:hypothetical protein Lal_00024659 [Lupinus albus]|uniref:Uncharacterized protein n=1 Tax=Lupinus albus TaxID=3870 RepID=A0A6A5NNX2_LUPAL|nr:hypothetical protein Lalb_Chr10g0098271 [Lupinus albus]KAF1889336.1 hypothetical protein Lal_00024659 [Lupinus albus]